MENTESAFIVHEIEIDEKITNIFRTIQQQVMKFKEEYEGLNSSLGASSRFEEVKKIKVCMSTLERIMEVCANEIRDFSNHEKRLIEKGVQKPVYKQIVATVNEMIRILNGYLSELSNIATRLELPNITTKEAKELIEKDIASIYVDYNKFLTKEQMLVDTLKGIRKYTDNPHS